MTRKVGFDRPDAEPKKSIADSYLDEFRAKSFALPEAVSIPNRKKRDWATIVFLTVWITAWSVGILFGLGALFFGSNDPIVVIFLSVWVTAASLFWILAFKHLIKEARGKPMGKSGSKT